MKQIFLLFIIACISASCKIDKVIEQDYSLNSGITRDLQSFYQGRRDELMGKISEGKIILRADNGYSGGRHEFKTANNFYYLTGFTHSGSLLVLDSVSSYPYVLYVTEKTERDIIYEGDIPSADAIMNSFHADTVLLLQQSDKVIEECIATGTPMYIDNTDTRFRGFILQMIRSMKGDINLIRDISPLINEMRVIKDSAEIAEMQKAIDITGKGFINACRICSPGLYEYEVEAMTEYTYRKNGSSMPAFESIVGSGLNAVILHYSGNSRRMESGDLLLMDVGAEYGYLCADITRTIPVNGKFSKEQKEIYELVLKCQKAAIDEMIAGKHFNAGQNKAIRILVGGLYELGLITDTLSEWQKELYLLHPFSHYLGMDVHDVGNFGTTYTELAQNIARDTTFGRILEKGMVLTIEPGLYFRSNGLTLLPELFKEEASSEEIQNFIDKVAPLYEKYKNIGIRIEDDILITEHGNVNLSKNIPKEVSEIEKLMDKKNRLAITY